MQAILYLFSILPLKPAKALIRVFARLIPINKLRMFRVSLVNIKICFNELSLKEQEALAKESVIESLCSAYETLYALSRSTKAISKNIKRIDNKFLLSTNIKSDQGLIISGIHNRSVDTALQWISGQTPAVSLYKPVKNKALESYVKKHREQNGIKVYATNFSGVKELYKAINNNKVVIMASDQVPANGMGEYANFFNREAYTTTLITTLANKTKKPLIYIGLFKASKDNIKIVFKKAPSIKTVETMNSTMEDMIMQCPSDYSWEYKRFKKPPTGLVDPY